MRVALDTNFLVYAERLQDASKSAQAADVLEHIAADSIVIPAQVLGELHNVLVRKVRKPAAEARWTVLDWQDRFIVAATTERVIARAMDLAADHRFATWDGIILAAASEAGCRVLLSEDMQHGFTWVGVTVVNPFAATPHPLLFRITQAEH